MCGRISCHMCKEDYRKATSYFDKKNRKYVQPEWLKTNNCGLEFTPSTNIVPREVTPVLVSGDHYNNAAERVLQPMIWGMIPRWHKGDYKSHGLSTYNCRLEGMVSSKLYKVPLQLGQRCVIICEGFYEWQTVSIKGTGQSKQPYFIYATQSNKIKVEEESSWTQASWNEESGWEGPKLLNMAGLYDKYRSLEGEDIFSHTIITMESNKTWLHHRIPVVLDTDEAVNSWLDYRNTGVEDALECLKPVESLCWHPVSTIVNNAKNKDIKCNKPIDLKKPSASSAFMTSWLKRDSNSAKRSRDFANTSKEGGCVVKKSKEE